MNNHADVTVNNVTEPATTCMINETQGKQVIWKKLGTSKAV